MTRQEFLDNVTEWYELLDFCSDEGCNICEYVYDSDSWVAWIEDNLVEWARNNTWNELLDILNDLKENEGYDYYIYDDYYDRYNPANEYDFRNYKQDVLDWMDGEDRWDDEEDEEEEEDFAVERPADPENAVPTPQEDCTILDMFHAGASCLRTVSDELMEKARQEELVFADLTPLF